ncbi:hypothetical protein QN355_06285 [Cryobacterium sp. 10S3]|uniref:phage tail tape measure protein n=1 Tax=Cryobacterium sp. 10S3 TaxID=3048582 RepID=UPI002AC8DB71|nr:phage tail tape measure protein [Cryobacterium sp. 10S3]MEB0286156.1 hypothetical protein [Cryobacterium sp. 10S3]WPX12214.1 hypothetical protein RHM57_11025 [Cryobacterium sp. 10S3]
MSSTLDTEDLNAKMSASLGLLPAESKRIGEVSGRVFAQNYGENVGAVNGAVESVISSFSGMREASEADLESMTKKTLNFAKAFEVDVSRASQVAGQMVRQGLATDGGNALDLLTASMQKVPVELRGDLLDATDEYGGFFKQLGLGGERGMSMLVAASAKGMFGVDKTGDALKEFTIRATDMSASSVGAYNALGLSAQGMSNDILAGGDRASGAFQDIVSGLLSIEDPTSRANTAIALFGTPIEDLGTADIPLFLSSLQGAAGGLGEVQGATEKMGDVLNDTRQNRLETMKRGFEQWTKSMVDVPGPLGEISAGLVVFGPGVLEVLAALGPMAIFMGGPMASSLGVAGKAVFGFGVSLLASPITWIVLGIVAAIALLAGVVFLVIQNWDGIVAWFGSVWSAVWSGIQWFFGVITEAFLTFHPLGIIIKNWGPITEWFGNWWGGISGMASDALGWLGGKVGAIVGLFTSIPARVGDAWNGLVGLVRGVVKNVLSFAVDIWNGTLGTLNFDLPWILGGGHVQFPKFHLPALAAGGIVTGPTIALIGEAGPEAVVPLSRSSEFGMGRGGDQYVEVPIELSIDGTVLARILRRVIAKAAY